MPEESILTDTINLLSTGEATIFYHLVLTHSIFMALQVAFSQQPLPIRSRARRLRLGLFLLLAIRIFLFLVAGFVYQGSGNPHNVIPPLDRAANTLSLLIIVWLWVFPRKSRIGDIATAATLIFTIIFGFITLASWLPISNQTDYFNRTSLDTAWEMFSIFLILLSSAFLLIRKTDNWEYGLSMLVLLGIGDIAHYIIGATLASDYAITVRLAQIAAFPMLVSLAQTVVNPILDEDEEEEYEIPEEEPEVISQPPFIEDTKPTRVAPPRTAKPELLHVYLDLVGEEDPTKICKTLSKAISQTLLADICLILIPLEHGSNIILQCGYDLIREQSLDGASIDKQDIPSIATAMDKQRALRLPPKSKSPDLNGIAAALGLSKTGGLLAVPVNFPRSKTLATLVLLSPHSNYTWTKKDQTLLEKAVPGIAQLIQTAQGTQPKTTPPEQSVGPEFSAQEFAYMEKYQSLSTLHKETENNLSKAQEEINALKDTIQSYQSASQQAAAAPEDSAQLEAELQQAYQQIENLQSAVTAANKKISVMSVQPALSNDEAEVIASIAQELRQPLSSITGYTDLLLNESVGILGASQRNFLERIKASIERVNSLINDLIQITTLDSGKMELAEESVNLNVIIDNTINETSSQMRQKDIVLRVDLPDDLPPLNTDKDAIQQILLHLIRNAGAATPADGEIILRANLGDDADLDGEYILVQVTDSGEGIPHDDLPRVFSRLYRADNPLIQGVGDTGVGLSIAKTLCEALGGKIWVDSDIGQGSTFSVLLPVGQDSSSKNGQGAS